LADSVYLGQKELRIFADDPNSSISGKYAMGVDLAKFGYEIGKMIEENIVDPSLQKWFMPTFTTTKKTDEAITSIIMMGAMQRYFCI
jgi:hypothetical protein